MINPTKKIGIVAIAHPTHFNYKLYKHYYAELYMARASFTRICRSKYNGKGQYTYQLTFKIGKR